MNQKILLIGESCMDIFYYCNADRLCPDIPVPALTIKSKKTNAGMAMNVYNNLSTHIKNCNIITNSDWESITKTRYVDDRSNHMFIRIDTASTKEKFKLTEKLKKNICETYGLIMISDYNKGFMTENDIQSLSLLGLPTFLDTKKILGAWATHITYIKINDFEYKNSKNYIDNNQQIKNIIIHTDGGNGCYFRGKNYKTKYVDVKDTSGAGDTFFAALVIEYLKSYNIKKAINFANKSALKVVKQRGVTTL